MPRVALAPARRAPIWAQTGGVATGAPDGGMQALPTCPFGSAGRGCRLCPAQVTVSGGASAHSSAMRWIRRPVDRPGVRTRTRRRANHAITEHGPDPGHVLLCAERGPRLYVHGNRPRVGAAGRGSC